jgi:hypothetical protein
MTVIGRAGRAFYKKTIAISRAKPPVLGQWQFAGGMIPEINSSRLAGCKGSADNRAVCCASLYRLERIVRISVEINSYMIAYYANYRCIPTAFTVNASQARYFLLAESRKEPARPKCTG